MSELPENRKPLLWKDIPFSERPKAHPSSWEGEAKISRITISRLEARVAELESIVLDYRHVLNSAKTGRDLYRGMYVAKEYHFTRDQIDAALSKINAALKGKDHG
jgi:hypothetical protein